MKDLSLYLLDIAQNSIRAGAKEIVLTLEEKAGILLFIVRDDGCGMDAQMLRRVTDPFCTTRTTRPVGLGLALLREAAQQTGGELQIESEPGVGTTVQARFLADSIDMPPLGNLSESVSGIIQGAPAIEYLWTHTLGEKSYTLDTRVLREALGEVTLDQPEVALWIREYIEEQERLLIPKTN